jgi:hypothetical protein
MLYHPLIKSKAAENPNESKMKKVEVCALEFDWIFHGKDSDHFIERLAKTENDDLFTINSVRELKTQIGGMGAEEGMVNQLYSLMRSPKVHSMIWEGNSQNPFTESYVLI